MKLKDFLSSFIKRKSGWNYFFTTSGYYKRKNAEYYFGIIFTAIDAIAKAVQNVNYGLYQKKGDNWVEVEHDALKLLKTPNKIHSDRDFLYTISSHIDLYGQSFLWPVRTALRSRRIIELRLLNPANVTTLADYDNLIAGYKWVEAGKMRNFKPDELVNILRPDPLNMIEGLSTIQKARYEGDNELNSQKLNASFYENGGLPSGVISTDAEIDQKVFQMLKSRIKTQYEGVKNAFKIMFLSHGATYKPIQPTQRDMEYVAQRKLNRDQILTIFQVPPSVVSISENSNRATAEVEYRSFMKNTVEPRLKFIFDKLNRFYLPLFEGTENMEFRFESVVPVDKEFELKTKVESVNVWRTPNEIRQMEGLEPIEGGDSLDTFGTIQPLEPVKEAKTKKTHKHKIEDLPSPSKLSGKHKLYARRRNAYIQAKEKKLTLELEQHFNFFIRDLKKVKKSVDLDEDKIPENIMEKVLPEKEKREQWKTLLYLILLRNLTQIWKTVNRQLNDIYGFKEVEVDGLTANFISHRANFSAKSINDTLMRKIRTSIDQSIKEGNIDLKTIKSNIVKMVGDIKDWKAEQIARTELAWGYSEAQMKVYEKNGVEKVKWICGGNACEICQANCGQEVKLNDTFPSGHTNEPAHINCRCMVVAV